MKKLDIKDDIMTEIIKMYEQGVSIRKLSAEYSINRYTLARRLNELGIREPDCKQARNIPIKERTSQKDIEIIKDYTENGLSATKTCKKHSINNSVLEKILKYHKISKKPIKRYRKHYFNETVFEMIDNEHKAYWLGFLMADGYVGANGAIEITLKEEDKRHLEKLVNFISGSIEQIKPKIVELNGKQITVYRLTISSRKMANDLLKYGCVQNKSLTLKFPQLNHELINHFMRGYFDGDGGIYVNKSNHYLCNFYVISSSDFINAYRNILIKELSLKTTKDTPQGKAYRLNYGGKTQVKKFLNIYIKTIP